MISHLEKFRGQRAPLPARMPARQVALAGLGAALGIGFVGALADATRQPLLLGSLGASCVFLFGLPEAPSITMPHTRASRMSMIWWLLVPVDTRALRGMLR